MGDTGIAQLSVTPTQRPTDTLSHGHTVPQHFGSHRDAASCSPTEPPCQVRLSPGLCCAQRSPGLEFFGAEGVRDVLDGVAEAVCVVIRGVDAPARQTQSPMGQSPVLLPSQDVPTPRGRRPTPATHARMPQAIPTTCPRCGDVE